MRWQGCPDAPRSLMCSLRWSSGSPNVLIKVELWLLVWPYVCPDDEDDLKQSCVTHDDLKLSRMGFVGSTSEFLSGKMRQGKPPLTGCAATGSDVDVV
eukprot:1143270-Pelagomonas_calceolata.AAC.2